MWWTRAVCGAALAVVVGAGSGCPAPAKPAITTAIPARAAPPAAPAPAPPRPHSLALGAAHTCVVDVVHRVWCWGNNERGQLGAAISMAETPVHVNEIDSARTLAAGGDRTCAADAGGRVWCWGGGAAEPQPMPGLAGVTQLAITGRRGCAVSAGGIACWRWPDPVPALVSGLPIATAVTTAGAATCTLGKDHSVYCWTSTHRARKLTALGPAASVTIAGGSACAVRLDGTLSCVRIAPAMARRMVTPRIKGAELLTAGTRHTCARDVTRRVWCWGDNRSRQLGYETTGPTHDDPKQVAGVGPAAELAAGDQHTCVVTRDGAVWCWGNNLFGQLGRAPLARRGLGKSLPALETVRVLAGSGERTCAVLADGTTRCWGSHVPELGAPPPDAPHPMPAPDLPRLQTLSLGYGHGCGMDHRSAPVCWGNNDAGQLGRLARNAPAPGPVPGMETAHHIAVGYRHTCAIDQNRGVSCWGDNSSGQLTGTQPRLQTPTSVAGATDSMSLALSDSGTCVVDAQGAVRCWGFVAGVGQRRAPTVVAGLPPATAVAHVRSHGCALGRTGEVWCWGRNRYGQLGDGTSQLRSTPRKVRGISDAVAVAVALNRSCAVRRNGSVSCWGVTWRSTVRRCKGTRAAPARPCNTSPVAVRRVNDVAELSMGTQHTCARRRDGTVRCWGPRLEALGWGADADLGQPKRVGLPPR